MKKVLLTFCGTLDFKYSYTTIGDIMAVYNVALKLLEFRVAFDIAFHGHLLDLNNLRVDIRQINPDNYSDLLYVCGPVSHTAKKLSEFFLKQRRVAIGVSAASIIPTDIFHKVYLRDSEKEVNFDLALADIGFPHIKVDPRQRQPGLSLCIVGSQGEYGLDNGASLFGKQLTELLSSLRQKNKIFVQTLYNPNSPNPLSAEIEIQCSRLLLTNRMHGALLAIYHRLPVLVFDQIRYGAKVTRMMNKINWPVFNFYEFDNEKFNNNFELCKLDWSSDWMEDSRSRMIEESRLALDNAIDVFLANTSF